MITGLLGETLILEQRAFLAIILGNITDFNRQTLAAIVVPTLQQGAITDLPVEETTAALQTANALQYAIEALANILNQEHGARVINAELYPRITALAG